MGAPARSRARGRRDRSAHDSSPNPVAAGIDRSFARRDRRIEAAHRGGDGAAGSPFLLPKRQGAGLYGGDAGDRQRVRFSDGGQCAARAKPQGRGRDESAPDRSRSLYTAGALPDGGGGLPHAMSDLRATRPEEADRIRAFLARVFRAPQESPAWNPRMLSWKYYEPRPDWEGSRSYVLEAEGGYASHGCVWPVTFASASKEIRAAQVIDWAADPAMPGAGVLLRRRVQDLAPVSLAIGGSDATRKVLPRAGYATRGMYRTFVRVVRPFRQFLQRHDGPLWKRPARTARNTAWSFASMPEEETVWRAEPVDRF